MSAVRCNAKYFCIGPLLVFAGSVLLCACGFTVVLPYQKTRHWRRSVCNVTLVAYEKAVCACQQQLTNAVDSCLGRYPCLRVIVDHVVDVLDTVAKRPPAELVADKKAKSAQLYRAWEDAFYQNARSIYHRLPPFCHSKNYWRHDIHQVTNHYDSGSSVKLMSCRTPLCECLQVVERVGLAVHEETALRCTLYECGASEWNIKETKRFLATWGRLGHTFTCYVDPADSRVVILRRVPVSLVVHAVVWPGVCLLAGAVIWITLCLGGWRIETNDRTYALHTYGLGYKENMVL